MDLGSPDKFSVDDMNPREDDISNVGKLDLNLAVRKEAGERYGHESEAMGDRTQVDLNHKHHGPSSLHAVIRTDKPESPYNNSSSQVQYELFNGNGRTEDVDFNGERAHSYQGGEAEFASSRCSDKSSSPVEAANFQPELEMEDSARLSLRLSPEVDSNYQLDDIKEKSLHHGVLIESSDKFSGDLQHERTESAHEVMKQEGTVHLMEKEYSRNDTLMEDKYYSKKPLNINGEVEGRNAEVHALGRTPKRSASPVRESSVSPVRPPPLHGKLPYSPQGHHYSLYSPRSSRRKISPSPERIVGDGRRVPSEDHPSLSARQTSPSPSRRSRRESPRRDVFLRKRLSSSPRRRQFSPDRRRRDRTVSRSPTSPERTGGDGRRVLSEDHPSLSTRQSSPSPSRRSQLESPRRDESLGKRPSSSPRRRHLSLDRRRADRSVSRSPTRNRDSSYGSRRDHHDRSRSRSPHARDHHRRSPRRYSPRRRSPPGYYSRRRSPRRKPWSPPRNRNNGVGRPGNNLFVAGFSFVTTERDLERKFSRFGRVRDVRIVRDKRSGDSRGFGFLSLERDEDADAAIRALDQTDWNGRVVLVEKSKSH